MLRRIPSGAALAAPGTALSDPPPPETIPFRPLRPSPPVLDDTVLYLAYGSNLAAATFEGMRGIVPLAAVNVVVPTLRLRFDLPGLPYVEPCFANSARRDPHGPPPPPHEPYHKDRWHKGLVGVVYRLTRADFAHVIATEGGGAEYQDVLVECYPLAAGADEVPAVPTGAPLQAHTLLAPGGGARFTRPNLSYAQPSARYLGLLATGAAEHDLPAEYRAYLAQLRPYRITTLCQRVGMGLLLALWGVPLMFCVKVLSPLFAGADGKVPPWLMALMRGLMRGVWGSYDAVYYRLFGDGERSIPDRVDLEAWGAGGEKSRLLSPDFST